MGRITGQDLFLAHRRLIMKKRPNFARPLARLSLPGGFTLVEMLVALTLTLILMTAVVKVFGDVGPGIANARKALEQFDRLRTAQQQLNSDLNNMTARLDGRAGRPEEALGYFEAIEGSYLFATAGTAATIPPYYAINGSTNSPDYSVGERGDILMFTARCRAALRGPLQSDGRQSDRRHAVDDAVRRGRNLLVSPWQPPAPPGAVGDARRARRCHSIIPARPLLRSITTTTSPHGSSTARLCPTAWLI